MDAKVAHPDQLEEVQAVGHRGRRGIVVTTFSAKETTDTPHTPGYEIYATEMNGNVNCFAMCYVRVSGFSADFPFWLRVLDNAS